MILPDDPAAVRLGLADALELIEKMLATKAIAPHDKPACHKLLATASISALRGYWPNVGGLPRRP